MLCLSTWIFIEDGCKPGAVHRKVCVQRSGITQAPTCAAAGSKTSIIVDDNSLLTRLTLSHLPSPNHHTRMQGSIKESKRWWDSVAAREAHSWCHSCMVSLMYARLPAAKRVLVVWQESKTQERSTNGVQVPGYKESGSPADEGL